MYTHEKTTHLLWALSMIFIGISFMIWDTCRQSGRLSKFIYTVEYCTVIQKSEPRWRTHIEGFQQYTLEEKLQYVKMMQPLFLFHYFSKQTSAEVCLRLRKTHRCSRHQPQRWQGQGVVATWYQIWGKSPRDPITEGMISKQVSSLSQLSFLPPSFWYMTVKMDQTILCCGYCPLY